MAEEEPAVAEPTVEPPPNEEAPAEVVEAAPATEEAPAAEEEAPAATEEVSSAAEEGVCYPRAYDSLKTRSQCYASQVALRGYSEGQSAAIWRMPPYCTLLNPIPRTASLTTPHWPPFHSTG